MMAEDAATRLAVPGVQDDRVTSPGPTSHSPLVSMAGVWRYWGRGRSRWAVLRDIDLQVPSGTATCVTGRNGVGKTTLLRIATGILAPDRGSVMIDGMRASGSWREYHRRVGFVSAGDRGLYARVTVKGHLEHWTALAHVPRGQRRALVAEALARFDLAELAGRRVDRLSQGQRQRLRLALALAHRPKVLLLDEPRNSLDGEGQEMLASAVSELLRSGGAVLCCSPAGDDQLDGFDRLAVIEDGTLRFT
jgi:ABC-2 type transport system ATP-binding protein